MPDVLTLKKSNCKNCYKCIRHCPVKSIRFSAGQAHIVGGECILCGQCFVVCPQNAKEIVDDTDRVRQMLREDAPVVASIAPSFVANYIGVGIDSLRVALRQLGFADAEETAVGATMVKTEYERILHEEKRDIVISSCCHSVNLLIQKHYPALLPYLADVVSPMQAHCLDMKRRFPGAKTVFIGPCVAKKDEAQRYPEAVDAVLTFEELSRFMAAENVQPVADRDKTNESRARFFPTAGGILKTMACEEEGYDYLAIDGAENCMAALHDIETGELTHCFLEMSICSGSCIGGPVMEKLHRSPVRGYQQVASYAGKRDFAVEMPDKVAMKKAFPSLEEMSRQPNEAEVRAILQQMGKTKPEDELNCGSCGYNTCREKAVAVFQGKADLSMCLPFLKEKAESFSDTVFQNTPNGIVVLNEDLEVQQINRAACEIMNIRHAADVLGEPVVRILDPVPFMDVRQTGKSLRGERTYLAEYKKYVEETILYNRDYRMLLCVMRDITDEETARERKEAVRQQTAAIADTVVEKQMRVVQEIASLLGETTAETKIALTRLKESIADE